MLRIEEVAIPEPGEGESLVYVKAAAINPSDIVNVAGRFKNTTLPRTPAATLRALLYRESSTEKRSGAVLRSSVSSVTDLTRNMLLSQRKR